MATTTPYYSYYGHGTLLFSNYQFTQDYKKSGDIKRTNLFGDSFRYWSYGEISERDNSPIHELYLYRYSPKLYTIQDIGILDIFSYIMLQYGSVQQVLGKIFLANKAK